MTNAKGTLTPDRTNAKVKLNLFRAWETTLLLKRIPLFDLRQEEEEEEDEIEIGDSQ